ncbi:MAG: T9SS type A sorting domain-containing protein [Crocinitomicaceae bacterium]|nr:T9SS type A sorting domain-containing protein [Crocinitomicaceae bacterium]
MRTLQLLILFIPFLSIGQLGNTMYGLYRNNNPSTVQLATIDPTTGVINVLGPNLGNTINLTGVSLNPYNYTYTYQDQDSWLSVDLTNGGIVNDVVVSLPSATGNFDNFKFNTSDTTMYGIFSQVLYNPTTGVYSGDMRLATCDLSTGQVALISPASVASSYVMAGSSINPHLMVYYFISEGKLMGIDLYNGSIYTQPLISIPSGGDSFDNFAYSCVDTTMYGLIVDHGVGVLSLGKINASTGVVTPLPTALNFDNYIMNGGATIDPINHIYYFETMDNNAQIYLVGLSLLDGSIVSNVMLPPSGTYFDMARIDGDCYGATPSRLNLSLQLEESTWSLSIAPNPSSDVVNINSNSQIEYLRCYGMDGKTAREITMDGNNQISIKSFPKGVYMLEVRTANTSRIVKLVKD